MTQTASQFLITWFRAADTDEKKALIWDGGQGTSSTKTVVVQKSFLACGDIEVTQSRRKGQQQQQPQKQAASPIWAQPAADGRRVTSSPHHQGAEMWDGAALPPLHERQREVAAERLVWGAAPVFTFMPNDGMKIQQHEPTQAPTMRSSIDDAER